MSEANEVFTRFCCEYNRESEESFARTFSEKDNVRLFFINENSAFTDGRNIIVDPGTDGLYEDTNALIMTEKYMHLPRIISNDMWYALRMITRAQTIHECLHILYTDFPCAALSDPKCNTKNKLKIMAFIQNIIEDAYIEALGSSVYDNLELYLTFGRVSRIYASRPSPGSAEKVINQETELKKKLILTDYLNYMIGFLLYPMIPLDNPDEDIAPYVYKTKEYFTNGSMAESSPQRYGYTQRIFEIIESLIPDDDEEIEYGALSSWMGGHKTHSPYESTIGAAPSKGRSAKVKKAAANTDFTAQLLEAVNGYEADKNAALKLLLYTGSNTVYTGSNFDCAVIHNKIKINVKKPKINLNLRKAYGNIYCKYRVNINSYNSRFSQLLKAQAPSKEEKHLFGVGVSSRMLGDTKRRFWFRNVSGFNVPELAVMLLIDGSGSMHGERRNSAMISSVILHEVLKKQEITHCVVEHRGCFDEPEIDMNILVDFNARFEEKYNLMQLSAYGDNRDGLALFWAERYINKHTSCENKLIIVISDGVPAHDVDDYYPPVSTKDTANAVKKIIKRGTKIIAVSLDNNDCFDCYDALKEIFPNIVACNDLKRLTGQLLSVIKKQII